MVATTKVKPTRRRAVASLLLVALVTLTTLATLATGPRATADTTDVATRDGILRLHLIWTNDLHGHIAPEEARFMNPNFPPPLGGGASAARYIQQVRAEAEAAGDTVLLVDVGDMYQGTPIGTKTKGEAVIDYMNAVGYDFTVPGNHEFDFGRDVPEERARQSNFPWVCANLVEEETGEVVDWCVPTLMLDLQGIKVGVVGIITPSTEKMSFPEHVAGLDFLLMPETIGKYRDELLEQGADLIFLAIHEGLPFDPEEGWERIAGDQTEVEAEEQQGTYGSNYSYGGLNLMELVNLVPGIDFAVGGHTHRGYPEPWIDPVNHTLCFETYGNGSSIGHAILNVDRATRTLLGYDVPHDRGTIVTLFEDEIWPDPEITEVIRPWHEQAEAEMNNVVGRAAGNFGRGGAGANAVGFLVTDAMREYFDADFSFQNLGGLRADIPSGPITSRDVFTVLPFGNELVEVELEGTMLRRIIERKLMGSGNGIMISGARVVYDTDRPEWDRVVALEVAGETWNPDRMYRAVVTSFLMEGNSGLDFLTTIPPERVMPTQIKTAEALERYLLLNDPVRPTNDGRWVERPGEPQADYLKVDYLP